MSDDLTCYNLLLSEPKKLDLAHFADISCSEEPSEIALAYIRECVAKNTQIAYRSDLAHFERWGGQIPAAPETIVNYLAAFADTLTIATLNRRLAALSKAHRSLGLSNPTSSELVKSTVRGIRRVRGVAQRQAKALLNDHLVRVLDRMDDRLKDTRDCALLLIGFAGGFRRSELVGLTRSDVEFVREGIVVHLRRSKADQFREGRKIGIPYARGRWCPVVALEKWLNQSKVTQGPLFRSIDRHQRIGMNALSGESVCLIVRKRIEAAGVKADGYSAHSLRSGLATSAARAGASSWKIRQQTGHASDAMLARYIREGELFVDNAAGALL